MEVILVFTDSAQYPLRILLRAFANAGAHHTLKTSSVIIACLVLRATTSTAQSDPRAVQPERPTVATHAGTVAPGYLEIETGIEWDRFSGGTRGSVIPAVFKFGLNSHAQLSVSTPSIDARGAIVGVKWRLLDDSPLLGRFAILPTVTVATGSTQAGLLLISSHNVGPVAVDINAGYTRRVGDPASNEPRDATVWTVSTGGPAVGRLGWVAEVFGYPRTTGPAGQPSTVAALFGPTMSARTWLALDAGVIVPIAGSPPRAVYAGGVWNVGRVYR